MQTLCIALATIVLAPVVSAQLQFAEGSKDHVRTPGPWHFPAGTLGDVDGDGDLDLLGANLLQINDGTGRLSSAPGGAMPPIVGPASVAVAGDVDGNGTLDLLVGMGPRRVWHRRVGTGNILLLGNGRGRFTDATATHLPAIEDITWSADLADLDGDGDLDLAIGNEGENRIHLNDGRGHFADAPLNLPKDVDDTQALALVDLDGDRDLDLVAGNAGSPSTSRLYFNDGRGRFTAPATQPFASGRYTWTRGIAAGDVDGDGDIDLVLGRDPIAMYLNDGRGGFQDGSHRLPPGRRFANTCTLFDLDGDGDLDLTFHGYHDGPAAKGFLYANDGRGWFTDVTPPGFADRYSYVAAILRGDLDADGDEDLVRLRTLAPPELLLNGRGELRRASGNRKPRRDATAMAVFDLDADGDNDVLQATRRGHQVWRNDGTGDYVDGADESSATASATVLAAGDVDGDGDLDVIAAWHDPLNPRAAVLLRNDGSGKFTVAPSGTMPAIAMHTASLALGDVDRDGDLDLVLGNQGGLVPGRGQDRLFRNDGRGRFSDVTSTHMPTDQVHTSSLLLIDVDGDGDDDLVCATDSNQDRLYQNDGRGRFANVTATRFPADSERTVAVTAADVDGDGDVDLFLASRLGANTPGRLYLNNGRGRFTVATGQIPASKERISDARFTDLDEDGDADLLLGVESPASLSARALRNDGRGRFTDVTTTVLGTVESFSPVVRLADVDGDGDLDLFLGSSQSFDHLLVNRHRQLRTPWLARLGHEFGFEIYSRPGLGTAGQQCLLFTSLAKLPVPIRTPFGRFGVGPTGFTQVGPLRIGAASGMVTHRLTIPRLPALSGLTVYSQALVAPNANPSNWRLTNLVADRVGF